MMCAASGSTGGFNFEQSDQSMTEICDMSASDWEDAANQSLDRGFWQYVTPNLNAQKAFYQAKIDQRRETLKRDAELRAHEHDLLALETATIRMEIANGAEQQKLNTIRANLLKAREQLELAKAERLAAEVNKRALQKFANALEDIVQKDIVQKR